ncbi:MAG: hypothetical protein C0456_08545 [Hyphomonas sp.]|uniref:hypothetical protein n=1 Tax=Hyphomonas sp. TaxID=87 RepID=UPI001D6DE123|nr:hypothetical protein [Hyphomonas sp.]MBA4226668.1 hypothetical protein [Hyphomonas sp.]
MKRYFFSAVNSDGENANVFIDADSPESAITQYHLWSARVMGTIQTVFQMWRLPDVGTTERALEWYEDVFRFN